MLLFGVVQVVLSQVPDFHNLQWLSIVAAIMSVSYASIGFAQVIGAVQHQLLLALQILCRGHCSCKLLAPSILNSFCCL